MTRGRVVVPLMLATLVAFAAAQAADWGTLGSGTLVFKKPQLSIKVKKSAPPCSEIRFQSTGDMVNLTAVKITFDDGTWEEVEISKTLRPGMASDPIKVVGGPRELERVEISHDAAGRGASSRATITVQGRG